MAFTDAEKSRIRNFLGWSELFRDIDTRLEMQMNDIGDRAPQAETNIRTWLSQLDTIDEQIFAIAAGGELRLSDAEDGVKFDATHGIQTLQNYGRTLIQRIAITFFVTPQRDYYDTATTGNVVPIG